MPTQTSVSFPLGSSPGAHPQEGGGRLINCFVEPLATSGPSDRVYRRVPGLVAWGTTNETGFRGGAEINGLLYTAWQGKLVKHTSAGGAATVIGTLNGTRPGFFARNNKYPTPDIVFVDPDANIATITSSSVTNGYPDIDLPSVTCVAAIDGYIVFGNGNGQIWATDLNSTDVNALSFGKAESKPDGIVRIIAFGGQLIVMGEYTTEIWVDAGTSPFPFSRSTIISRGLIGPYAVSGFEDRMTKGLIWVAEDGTVVQLDGYEAKKVSPPDLDRLVEAVADKSTLVATSYMSGGHAFWELSCAAWTWVYDINNGQWHERRAYLGTRSRIAGAVPAFGSWLAGDASSGAIGTISDAVYQDFGSPLPMRIESGPVTAFPNRTRIARADFLFSVGVGVSTGVDPIETDPSVEISWSDDGGRVWSNALQRRIGRQSRGDTRVTVFNTGLAGPYGRRWRLDISDPVYVGFMGATQSTETRNG